MKLLLTIILSVLCSPLFAQVPDSCGINNEPRLTATEATFLNAYYAGIRKNFDFTDKKILFVTGTAATQITGKTEYFKSIRSNWNPATNPVGGSDVDPLTVSEKKRSNGYDAVVYYWVKLIPPRGKQKIIEQAAAGL